jgi:ABC-type sugar transport system substrate-binding protein
LTAAFATTADGPTVWSSAAEENGLEIGEIAIIGMDYTRVNLDTIKSGEVFMVVAQPAFEEGYYAVVLLANSLLGIPIPYENYLPAPQVTLENVDEFYAINDLAESYFK